MGVFCVWRGLFGCMPVAVGRRPVNGWLRLAFWLSLVPGRQERISGRYLCELEGVLAFEQACHPRVCLIGDGLWAR